MHHEAVWSIAAKKDLDELPNLIAQRIIVKVHGYCASPNPMAFAKGLAGNFKGYYRFRVGKYRVIFEKEARRQVVLLLVLAVDKRDDVYS
jgi:mRNA interferase RelE/StbE